MPELVVLNTDTRWITPSGGVVLCKGRRMPVDEKTAERWVSRNIAHIYDKEKDGAADLTTNDPGYANRVGRMKRPELMKECKNLGIKFDPKDTNAVLIERILNEKR
jgi:hypothetical protein